MKKLGRKLKQLLSSILYFFVYIFMLIFVLFAAFAVYVKIYSLDISFLISYLKQEQIIDQNTKVEKLSLEFERSFIISAKNVSLNSKFIDLNLAEADIELARSSIFKAYPSIKSIDIDNANITINADNINKNKQKQEHQATDLDLHNALKQASYFKLLQLTKYAEIDDSVVTIIYNNEKQILNNINITFRKTNSSFNFLTKGKYQVLRSDAPFSLEMDIPENTENIKLKLHTKNIKLEDVIKSLTDSQSFNITGFADTNIETYINKKNQLVNIKGNLMLNNGFVEISNLYNNKLVYKNIATDFNYDIKNKLASFTNASLLDKDNNMFDLNAVFSHLDEPKLNITAQTKQIDIKDAFKYIPDLAFKPWIDTNITKGTAKDVIFKFIGPLRPVLDGENGNPYFDIVANFQDLTLTYLDNLPSITNASGQFSMIKKDIDIDINNAKTSEQDITRGSVKIAPLFEKDLPMIKINSLSKGSVEDALFAVNKKLDLKQDELFSKFKGLQETQATIHLNLNNLENTANKGTDEEKFITVDVLTEISEVTGVEPAFMQRFNATDSILTITEEDFKLDATGFIDENPFHIILKEKLLEFGQHTDVQLSSNLDSFLIKEYLDIPSFNLSGLVNTDIKLKKDHNTWDFDLKADVEDSLINFGLLNYTKPFTQKGLIKANGKYNLEDKVLGLKTVTIDAYKFKANGSTIINFKNIQDSTVDLNNLIINDTTNIDKFTLVDHVLTIKGKSLDLRPLSMKTNDKATTKPNKKQKTINSINVKLDKLYLNKDKGLVDVSILLNLKDRITGLIKLKDNPNAQSLYIKLTPEADNKVRLEALVPNIGNLLRKSKLSNSINSGFGVLYGDLVYDNNLVFDFADLKLSVKKFQLLEAPLLAQALSILSLEQLFTKKKGILFDSLYTKIHYEDGILKLTDAKIKGPSLGLSIQGLYDTKTSTTDMSGTLVPVVKLNSVLGSIPVLGYILTGSQGAISGADFKVYTNKKGKTDVSVSPLSVVTPGIVKDIFSSVGNLIPGLNNDGSKIIEKARERANIESKEK